MIYDGEDDDANDAETSFASADPDDNAVLQNLPDADDTITKQASALANRAITRAHTKANTKTSLDSIDKSDDTVRQHDHDLPDDGDDGTSTTSQASASAPRAKPRAQVQANERALLNMADQFSKDSDWDLDLPDDGDFPANDNEGERSILVLPYPLPRLQ
jgi:hypothetical protein